MRGDHGGRQAQGHREQRGRAHHAVDRGLHRQRRDPRRRDRQAPGGDQREEHHLRGEAPHRPPVRGKGGQEGRRPHALQDLARRKWRRVGRGARTGHRAPAGVRRGASQDEEDRRGLPGRAGHRGGDHRPRVLQRFAAPGHEGRRAHRWPRGEAHHQRAHGGRARLRSRQEGRRPQDRRLRPGRRHLRHLHHRDRRSRGRAPVRGALHERRHLPRRRGLRPAPDRLHRRGVPQDFGRGPVEGPDRAAAREDGRRARQDRALVVAADRAERTLHRDGRRRALAPHDEDHAREVRVARGGPDRAHDRALPHRHQGRGHQGLRRGRRDPRGRNDAHAEGAGKGEGVLRQGAAAGT